MLFELNFNESASYLHYIRIVLPKECNLSIISSSLKREKLVPPTIKNIIVSSLISKNNNVTRMQAVKNIMEIRGIILIIIVEMFKIKRGKNLEIT